MFTTFDAHAKISESDSTWKLNNKLLSSRSSGISPSTNMGSLLLGDTLLSGSQNEKKFNRGEQELPPEEQELPPQEQELPSGELYNSLDSFLASMIEEHDLIPTSPSYSSSCPFWSNENNLLRSRNTKHLCRSTFSSPDVLLYRLKTLSNQDDLIDKNDSPLYTNYHRSENDDKLNISSSSVASATQTIRVAVILLCFVALPEKTEDCFLPTTHLSHIDMFTHTILELPYANFFVLRFRGTYWLGVISTAATKSARRIAVLNWVRQRKTGPTPIPLQSTVSSPDLLNNPSPSDSVSNAEPCPKHSFFHNFTGCARYRDCSAVLCVCSGEILGIAPCQKSHQSRGICHSTEFCRMAPIMIHNRQQLLIEEAVIDWLNVVKCSS